MATIEDLKAGHVEPESDRKPAASVTTPHRVNLSAMGKDKSNREKADFSHLPKEKPGEDPVEIKESLQKEILGPNGPFQDYVNEKIAESRAYMEEYEKRAELDKAEGKSDQVSDALDEISADDIDTAISEASLRPVTILEPIARDAAATVQKTAASVAEVTLGAPSIAETPVEETVEEEIIEEPEVEEEVFEEPVEESVVEEQVPEPAPQPAIQKPKAAVKMVEDVTRKYMAIEDEEDEPEEEVVTATADDDDAEEEARLNELKALITEKIRPIAKRLDLSTFTVASKGTTSNNILNGASAGVAKWVLPATGTVIEMREISGTNIEHLREHLERNVPNVRAALKIMYDHITSPKPESFEVWMKSIAFTDYDHLFMAIYIAAFAEANYLPIDCQAPGCNKVYLTDSVPIMSMVDFKDKESEEKFWKLYRSEPTNGEGLYTTEIVAISDKIAISFVEPSIYSVLVEAQYFDNDFQEKYSQIIEQLPYIDKVYSIDAASHQLIPIEWKEYPTNAARTARSKVQRFHKVINSLSADQNAIITACINSINERINWFGYQLPETTCPKCGHVNPAQKDQSASALVFLRSRLAVLATI